MDQARLKDVPLFADLSRRKRKVVAQHADEIDLAAGATLSKQGQLGSELFIVLEGNVDVIRDGETIAQLGPGDVVGEIAVLETLNTTAGVIATTDAKVIVIGGAEMRALEDLFPEISTELRALIKRRLAPGS